MKNKIITLLAGVFLALLFAKNSAYAQDLDYIRNYVITADVRYDATVHLTYHIDWEVLESDQYGPVSWVNVAIPNEHYSLIKGLSDNISSIGVDYGSVLRIDFDKSYYEGEIISFDFEVDQDYLYYMNQFTDGETVYTFVPGWFDDIKVENLTINWSQDKAISWDPAAITDGTYISWQTSLSKGEKYMVKITYPNDAFAFDISKTNTDTYDDDYDDGYSSSGTSAVGVILGLIFMLVIFGGAFVLPIALVVYAIYKAGKGFSAGSTTTTKKVVKRTLVKYYPSCPGCGATRPEGKEKCDYCGRSFIESEEVVEEKDLPDPQRYSTAGIYRYGNDRNTSVRVSYVSVPIVTRSPISSSRSSGSHSSCAHSSCAHSSCACACACACAGGGRAGCSTKDFYNTKLKLKQFKLFKK